MDQNEAINSINSDLIRGHIDTIILKALQAGDRYGYDIIKEIEHKSDGQYVIKQPTLYSCLKRLEVQGFVKSYWGSKSIGGRKKYFTLTDMGRELFLRNKSDWDYSRDVINKLISDDDYSADSYDDITDNSAEDEVVQENEVYDEIDEGQASAEPEEEVAAVDEMSPQDELAQTDEQPIEEPAEQLTEELETEAEPPITYFVEDVFDELLAYDDDIITPETSIEAEQEPEQEEFGSQQDEFAYDDELAKDETPEEDEETVSDEDEDEYDEEDDDEDEDEEDDIDDLEDEPIEPESEEDEIAAIEPEEDLPLSAAEQNLIADEPVVGDAAAEIIDKLYEDQERESYLTNVGNANYEPDRADSIDINDYFTDEDEEFEEDDEIAASEVSPAPQTDIADELIDDETPIRRITREPVTENSTVFYSYKRNLPEVDENSAIIDKEYRGVINSMIQDNVVTKPVDYYKAENPYVTTEYFRPAPDEPHDEPTPPPPTERKFTPHEDEAVALTKKLASETGENIDVRTHNAKAIRAYNNKHYFYSNQLRLLQCGILFGVMLLEIVLCFYLIEVVHNSMNISKVSIGVYIGAVVLAALLPIISFIMASTDYYHRKRINYSGKSSALFSIAATILLILIVVFANIYGGLLVGNIDNYLSSLIMPIVLSTNVIVNAIIFHVLYSSGRYNVEE